MRRLSYFIRIVLRTSNSGTAECRLETASGFLFAALIVFLLFSDVLP
jgi:hypothetical protein